MRNAKLMLLVVGVFLFSISFPIYADSHCHKTSGIKKCEHEEKKCGGEKCKIKCKKKIFKNRLRRKAGHLMHIVRGAARYKLRLFQLKLKASLAACEILKLKAQIAEKHKDLETAYKTLDKAVDIMLKYKTQIRKHEDRIRTVVRNFVDSLLSGKIFHKALKLAGMIAQTFQQLKAIKEKLLPDYPLSRIKEDVGEHHHHHHHHHCKGGHSHAKKPLLGIRIKSSPISMRGAYIYSVIPGGAADKYGLKKGDIILKVNDTKINSPKDLIMFIKTCKPGDMLNFEVYRNRIRKGVKVYLPK